MDWDIIDPTCNNKNKKDFINYLRKGNIPKQGAIIIMGKEHYSSNIKLCTRIYKIKKSGDIFNREAT
jgi:hypothetical protein